MNLRKASTIFSLILIFTLFITGIVLAVQYNLAASTVDKINFTTPVPDGAQSHEGAPINILLVCEENQSANNIYILNYSPDTNVTNILIIPGNTKTPDNRILSSIMGENGAMAMVDYIKAHIGINIKYYFKFDLTAFEKIVDSLDGVSFSLPVDFKSNVAQLDAGSRLYSGEMAVMLFRFIEPADGKYDVGMKELYDGTPYARTILHSNFISELFLQKANLNYISRVPMIIEACGTRIETNITDEDITKLVADADRINIKNITKYILSGTEESSGNKFFIFNGRIKEVGVEREYTVAEKAATSFASASLR